MRCHALAVCSLFLFLNCAWAWIGPYGEILRGDANNDGSVGLEDVVFIQDYLYYGGDAPTCLKQADVNDDGEVDISDASYLSNYLYLGGSAPPAPFPYCGSDPTEDDLDCDSTTCQ